jgi:hypothetical protein
MGLTELQEAWRDHSAQIAAEYEEWDANRSNAIPSYLDALNAFLRDRIDLSQFRSRIDSLSKSEPHWGFRGTSQMFFNQLVKAADHADLSAALRAALGAPGDEAEARRKIELLERAVEAARTRAEGSGATKPGIGRIDSFVSFFWELQDRQSWPMFYPNSRDVLEQQGMLDLNQGQADLYFSYRQVVFDLRRTLDTDTWGVEHLLWRLGKGAEEREEAKEEVSIEADAADLYASYREQNLYFPDEIVTSLVLSLATKRFVILSGISGTGKTKIALGLAKFLERGERKDGVVDVEPPRSDPQNIYIKLTAPKLQRGSVSLIAEAQELVARAVGLPPRGQSQAYVAKLPDGARRKVRLNNIGFTQETRTLYRLYLLKDVTEWLRENSKPGDYLHLQLDPEPGVDFAISVLPGDPAAAAVDLPDRPRRYTTIAVRSDWTDPRGLIGYFNPITRSYVQTELIVLLLRAAEDPGNPYILVLDEMNLARVEYYFSDFLSALESGEELGLMAPGVEEESAAANEDSGEAEVPGSLPIPPNVSFVGTVNIDETTHAFSPKVLDRANVIEFSEVDIERALGHGVERPNEGLRLRGGTFSPHWLCTSHEEAMRPRSRAHEFDEFTGPLEDVHAILSEFGRPFGYRVIDEVSAFVGHAIEKTEGSQEEIIRQAFDLQLQQKIVGKLSGGRELQEPLTHLLDYCLEGERRSGIDAKAVLAAAVTRLSPSERPIESHYPRTARRLLRMLNRVVETGFVGVLE